MSIKTPPPGALHHEEDCGVSTLRQQRTERLLSRIVGAVQMSPSTFYRPPNAVDTGASAAAISVASVASDAECAELLAAFNLVRDPEDRRRLLELVQKTAERA